jgi:hypothetical protein
VKAREFYRTNANLNALRKQLEELDRCARAEHGGSVRVALLLSVIGIVRSLLVEVQSLSDRVDAVDDALSERGL